MKSFFYLLGQIFILWVISELGYVIVNWLSLPLPGNVLGMVMLFILLITGIIKLDWIEKAATFLLKHLVFFFIPITVGIMTLGSIFLNYGISIMVILIISAAIGMVATGHFAQVLLRKRDVS